ncbi:MAG: hypothetical protein AAGB02_06785 [Pseudomonadota bacterium]
MSSSNAFLASSVSQFAGDSALTQGAFVGAMIAAVAFAVCSAVFAAQLVNDQRAILRDCGVRASVPGDWPWR